MLSADQGTVDKPGHTVSLIDTAAMTVRGTVGTGSGPHGVVIDTSGTAGMGDEQLRQHGVRHQPRQPVGGGGSRCRHRTQRYQLLTRPPPVLRPPRGMSPHHPRTPKTTPGNNHLTSTDISRDARPLESHPATFPVLFRYRLGVKRRSRRLLLTTNTELKAIAAPAINGLSSPAAANGSAATL